MKHETKAGLFTRTGSPVALTGVKVEARLSGPCLEARVSQRYRNAETSAIEAVYVFPLEEGAAVCGFEARLGDTLVVGRVEPSEKAFATYDDAMMDGHSAFLLEQERPDVFTASVGNLAPGEEVELTIRYVAIAPREGDATRLTIPTAVAPRYAPSSATPEVGQPAAERVSPPYAPTVPYGLALSVEIEAGGALASIDSPSHPIRTSLRASGARVELSQTEVALDRDFVLLVEREGAREPVALVARESDGTRFALVSFFPELEVDEMRGHEVVFLLDCSGSMQGESIQQAKRALALAIRALGARDTFQVVRFGSSSERLFAEPRAFDDASLEEATRYVTRLDADLGGTEILAPLTEILEAPPDAERPRRVLLLTDGQVANEAEVIALARAHVGRARIFTFGIGAGASQHLVRGVARASRGASELIHPGERIEPKVLRTFRRARTPALDDASVDWGELRVTQAPTCLPPVFSGDALTVLARVEEGSADEVTLVLGERRLAIPLDLERAAEGAIPTLWARERIRELEEGGPARRGSAQRRPEREATEAGRIEELGIRYGLTCRETSFVAVAERAPGARVDGPVELRRIPVAITTGWHGFGFGAFGRGAPTGGPPPPSAAMPMSASFAAPPAPRMAGSAVPRSAAPARAESFVGGLAKRARQAFSTAGEGAAPPFEIDREIALDGGGDPLFDLLMTQRADGSFRRSPALEACLGPTRLERLEAALTDRDEPLVVTPIVLAWLEAEAADRESEWRPAADKARRFLDGLGGDFDPETVLG